MASGERAAQVSLPLLTNSSMRTYRRCAEEYRLKYEAGIEPVGEKAHALRFGSAMHLMLEAWWGAKDGERLRAALAVLRAPDATTAEVDAYDAVVLRELMVGYDARWGGEPWEMVAVEAEFRVPHTNPETGAASRTWVHAGKVDAIIRHRETGRVLLCEHKTSGQDIGPGSEYWQSLLLDPQISLYYQGARALGHDIAGCLYDVIGKPKLRPKLATPPEQRKFTKDGRLYAGQRETDESPEEFGERVRADIVESPDKYYQRGEIVRLEREEYAFQFDAWAVGKQIRASQKAGLWPRNPDACSRWGRRCEFWDLCVGTSTTDDASRWKKRDWKHPELAQVTEAAPADADAIEEA